MSERHKLGKRNSDSDEAERAAKRRAASQEVERATSDVQNVGSSINDNCVEMDLFGELYQPTMYEDMFGTKQQRADELKQRAQALADRAASLRATGDVTEQMVQEQCADMADEFCELDDARTLKTLSRVYIPETLLWLTTLQSISVAPGDHYGLIDEEQWRKEERVGSFTCYENKAQLIQFRNDCQDHSKLKWSVLRQYFIDRYTSLYGNEQSCPRPHLYSKRQLFTDSLRFHEKEVYERLLYVYRVLHARELVSMFTWDHAVLASVRHVKASIDDVDVYPDPVSVVYDPQHAGDEHPVEYSSDYASFYAECVEWLKPIAARSARCYRGYVESIKKYCEDDSRDDDASSVRSEDLVDCVV